MNNTYMVFVKASKKSDRFEDLVLLKNGFNLSAMIFNILWLLFNNCYILTAISVILVKIIQHYFTTFGSIITYVMLAVLLGFEADDILISLYKRNKNYIFVGVIMGNSENEAKVKFLEEMNKEREKEMEKKE